MNLPKKYEDRMKGLLGSYYEDYHNCLDQPYYSGLRVNTLKIRTEEFEKISPFSLTKVPWSGKGFYYDAAEQAAKHPYYNGGLYYIQEPSAMAAAELLDVKPGDRVLDLCAAPGGKSTELAAKLEGRGVLVANDISNSRAKGLLKNLELFGVHNAIVMSEDPKKLAGRFEGYFDKILIDAPCSGEGMFRKEPGMMKNWEEAGVDYYSKIQKEIILLGAQMLKNGGSLVYSTCTFSPEEDEGVIRFLLEQRPDFLVEEVVSCGLFDPGRPDWTEGFEGGGSIPQERLDGIKNCFRLWPHKIKGEGHFAAVLKRKCAKKQQPSCFQGYPYCKIELPKTCRLFLKDVGISFEEDRFEQREERIYYLPEGLPILKGLRILRSGLYIGDVKNGRFAPSQAFANALKMEDYKRTIHLVPEGIGVLKYLKGETIEVSTGGQDGWNLICVDRYPLGWGKLAGETLKNKYYPGWRRL